MITDQQVRMLRKLMQTEKTLVAATAKAGIAFIYAFFCWRRPFSVDTCEDVFQSNNIRELCLLVKLV